MQALNARAAALLGALALTPWVQAASDLAQARATVVEAVAVSSLFGVPVSVQDLLLAQDAPAGPATGALVPRVASATTPTALRAMPVWIAAAVESRQAFGSEIVAASGSALLPRGPAAAVSLASSGTGGGGSGGDGEGPLVITIAFN